MGPIVWITGASDGIGAALAATVPWPDARTIGISRRPPSSGEHLTADLADPASWPAVRQAFVDELGPFQGDRAVLVHAAGTIDPIGFAQRVDGEAYTANVLLNSAASQVIGQAFLAASTAVEHRHVVMLTSGAARTPYPGWSSYGAAKAAVDQWCRAVGAEQARDGGAQVLAVGPGVVGTAMQARIRATSEEDFPQRQKFVDLHRDGKLDQPEAVARRIWALLEDGPETGSVLDLRDYPAPEPAPGPG